MHVHTYIHTAYIVCLWCMHVNKSVERFLLAVQIRLKQFMNRYTVQGQLLILNDVKVSRPKWIVLQGIAETTHLMMHMHTISIVNLVQNCVQT